MDAKNQVTTFKRDNLGRVTQTYNNGDPGANTYAWDPAMGKGHLASSTSFDGVKKTYTYDPSARLNSVKWTTQGRDLLFQYKYDDTLSRLDLLTYPAMGTLGSLVVKYAYDQAGQVDNIHRDDDASLY